MIQNLRSLRASSLARVMRGLWPDGNPLRRATDRAEAALVAGLLAAFVAGAPVVAITAGHLAAASMRSEQAVRYKMRAVLLSDAARPFYTPYGPVAMPVLARWTAPDGSEHAGLVDPSFGGRRGTTVIVWTSESGRLLGPPPRPGQMAAQAALVATAAPVILGLILLIIGMLALGALNRRRLAAWDAAWRITGPQWTGLR